MTSPLKAEDQPSLKAEIKGGCGSATCAPSAPVPSQALPALGGPFQ